MLLLIVITASAYRMRAHLQEATPWAHNNSLAQEQRHCSSYGTTSRLSALMTQELHRKL